MSVTRNYCVLLLRLNGEQLDICVQMLDLQLRAKGSEVIFSFGTITASLIYVRIIEQRINLLVSVRLGALVAVLCDCSQSDSPLLVICARSSGLLRYFQQIQFFWCSTLSFLHISAVSCLLNLNARHRLQDRVAHMPSISSSDLQLV